MATCVQRLNLYRISYLVLDSLLVALMQQVGEHESCGPGNLPSCGFTYTPEPFMAANIFVCNMSWRDMGVPTLDKMMDIVQVGQPLLLPGWRSLFAHVTCTAAIYG